MPDQAAKPSIKEYVTAHHELIKAEQVSAAAFQAALATGDLEAAKNAVAALDLKLASFNEIREQLTPRDLFVATYGVTVHSEHEVSFTLPRGVSRLEVLEHAQRLAVDMGHQNPIWPTQLQKWSKDAAFTSSAESSSRISIDGNVQGSTNKTREEQVTFLAKQSLQMPTLEDLAVAHAVYFIATGKDLFEGNWVRACGGALYFVGPGLLVFDSFDVAGFDDIAASAVRPLRN